MEISRREFLEASAMGAASMGLGREKKDIIDEKNLIYSYNQWPEKGAPADWQFYATACRECPAGCGLYTWHRDARCTKAEGIVGHPVNNGALCPRGQSSVQGHYDPDRLRSPICRCKPEGMRLSTADALKEIAETIKVGTSRVVIVSRLENGALAEVFEAFAGAFGADSKVLYYEPFDFAPLKEAHRIVFGRPEIPDYHIDQCAGLASFGADFLENWISPVQFATRFAKARDPEGESRMRFAYAGPRQSMTAANADDVLLLPPGQETELAMALAGAVGGGAAGDIQRLVDAYAQAMGGGRVPQEMVDRFAQTFAGGRGLALGGPAGAVGPDATMNALSAALINAAQGAAGTLMDFSRPHALTLASRTEDVVSAIQSVDASTVLIFHETNPAYDLPQTRDFIGKAGFSIYIGALPTETSLLCRMVLAADSPLESWGDYEPWRGVHNLMQPVTTRLWDTKSPGDLLMELAAAVGKPLSRAGAQQPAGDFEGWLRARWMDIYQRAGGGAGFEQFWNKALSQGGALEPAQSGPSLQRPAQDEFARLLSAMEPRAPELESGQAALWLWPSIMLYDGRTANRGWMQESPEPASYMAWGSWIDISAEDAQKLGVKSHDVLVLSSGAVELEAPANVTRDICPGVVALAYGQGHTAMGRNAVGRGANAFLLRGAAAVSVRKTGRSEGMAYGSWTQEQHDRELLQWTDHEKKPEEKIKEEVVMPLPEGYSINRDLYPPREYTFHRWAMAIDLERCIGCGACAVACYAENNLYVVGKEQMIRRREMAWLKVVPYRHPDDESRYGFLPLPCQHCDAAPCEPVCPVYAAVHNEEGLNAQIYNRCIGTRYCSNNCPYKVRRFNWLRRKWVEPLNLQLNPFVTVRCRGVMEKCTFCIQRIRQAEYRAAREGRTVQDGEIVPACAQTCPANAIIFGDLLDEQARVTQLFRESDRRYQVLKDLNTKPAIVYLRRMTGAKRQPESQET